MSINPTVTEPIFEVSLASHGILGFSRTQLAFGLAIGLYQYMQTGVIATSIDTGTLGAGTGAGVGVILPLPVITASMIGGFSGFGMIGLMSVPIATAVADGMVTSLSSAIMIGAHPGVGVGSGKLQLVPNGTGILIFSAAFKAAGLIGISVEQLAGAVSFGLDSSISSAFGLLAIAGPPNSAPGGGVGLVNIQ